MANFWLFYIIWQSCGIMKTTNALIQCECIIENLLFSVFVALRCRLKAIKFLCVCYVSVCVFYFSWNLCYLCVDFLFGFSIHFGLLSLFTSFVLVYFSTVTNIIIIIITLFVFYFFCICYPVLSISFYSFDYYWANGKLHFISLYYFIICFCIFCLFVCSRCECIWSLNCAANNIMWIGKYNTREQRKRAMTKNTMIHK